VVPQFLQATRREGVGELVGCFVEGFGVLAMDAAEPSPFGRLGLIGDATEFGCVDLDSLLLNAGHPPHPSAPPAPLQLPPPGQVPDRCSGSR
jgi:hypothetical protein